VPELDHTLDDATHANTHTCQENTHGMTHTHMSRLVLTLRRDMMVKRVFVLSDIDFDGWAGPAAAWDTEYQGISNQFSAEGFAVPEVVFWNVGTSKASMPVVAAQEGAALVSGYSKNLVRLFLEDDGNLTPATVMADAISGPEYDALEVFD